MMRPVLALHPMFGSGAIWKGVAERVGPPLLAPDLPGHGAEPEARGDYFAAALSVARNAVPEGRFHLVGHSFGAVLALALLAEGVRPDTVTLVEPVFFAAASEDARAAHLAQMAPFSAALAAGNPEEAARLFHGLWGLGAWETLAPRLRAGLTARITMIAATEGPMMDDMTEILLRLPSAPPPTLIVTETEPPAIVDGVAQGLIARLAGARIVRLGQGHMLPVTAPGPLARAMAEIWGD